MDVDAIELPFFVEDIRVHCEVVFSSWEDMPLDVEVAG